jgi:hypothetical protein
MIGKIARPKHIHIVPDMPKTRSGKLMRRVLAALSNNMNTGDITTLANPDVVESVRVLVQGKGGAVASDDGPEDLKRVPALRDSSGGVIMPTAPVMIPLSRRIRCANGV